jgi:hypothetical protein
MSIEGPKLSTGKGRWSKDPNKNAKRRRRLAAATEYKAAIKREAGLLRSRGAASECVSVELSETEKATLLAKYGE